MKRKFNKAQRKWVESDEYKAGILEMCEKYYNEAPYVAVTNYAGNTEPDVFVSTPETTFEDFVSNVVRSTDVLSYGNEYITSYIKHGCKEVFSFFKEI